MGFREALQSAPVPLTDADRRIGAILLNDRHQAALYTAAQLATQAQVHESTVVRFAQKLGYSGYLAMRLELASESMGRVRDRGKQPGNDEASLARVVRGQIEVLEKLEDSISQTMLDDAMAAMLSADRVYVVASGLAGPLADFFARKITLLGIPSIVAHQTGGELEHVLAPATGSDLVVFFLLSSEYEAVQPFEHRLLDLGATVILVTDQPILTFQPRTPFVLAVPRSELKHGVFVAMATVAYALDYSLIRQMDALKPPSEL